MRQYQVCGVLLLFFALCFFGCTQHPAPEKKTEQASPAPDISIKDIQLIRMTPGLAELDFKIDTTLPDDAKVQVAVFKENLTKDSFRRCTYIDPDRPVLTVKTWKDGTGVILREKELVECLDFHTALKHPKDMYPLISIVASTDNVNTEAEFPLAKAYVTY